MLYKGGIVQQLQLNRLTHAFKNRSPKWASPLADRSANINKCIDFHWADGVKTWGWDRSATQIQFKNVNTKLLGAIRRKCQNPRVQYGVLAVASWLLRRRRWAQHQTLNRPRLQPLCSRQRFPRHQKKQYATNDHIRARVCRPRMCAARHLHLSFNAQKIRLLRLNKVPLLSRAHWKDYSRRRKTRGY